ncbi:glycosyltransferase family 2 protein [Devosia psychrophila]|uniref:Glycosyltransferase involved in cell wall bisynthesis n=1 Tax=Devosia psychrophila TaxID=728005 RepID=A0A1I1RWM7_9HYPH|nr:glycosyltransferase family 2 protein [Devosia psychrophila]SFD35060.1 Glycosyltransferase involved in cell wall bisynthesis [Devosia psychrophila]
MEQNRRWQNLSVVVPAFNEQAGLGVTLEGLLSQLRGAEIIVVDDCSTDATSQVGVDHGVKVIRHAFNQGQGASLKTGMQHASRDYVAWFDADNEHRVEDLMRMVELVQSKDLVAVIGQRQRSVSMVRGAGKWLIRLVGKGLKINAGSDLNCGLRVFRRDVILRYLPLVPDRFSASLVTTLIMVERRYPISFEAISVNERIGQSTVRLRDGVEAIFMLVRSVLLFAPMRVFLTGGIGLIVLGTAYSAIVAAWVRLGIPAAGLLTVVLGMLLIILGLIADQISQLRLSQLPQMQTARLVAEAGAPSAQGADNAK